jgi:hypothetical protein
MQKMIVVLLLVTLISWIHPKLTAAAENSFKTIFKDGFYGGLAGALAGGAVLAFTDKPGDHLNYLSYGAAIGVIAGTVFGLVQTTQAMVQLENGRIAVGLPVPETRTASGLMGSSETEVRVGLFSWHF